MAIRSCPTHVGKWCLHFHTCFFWMLVIMGPWTKRKRHKVSAASFKCQQIFRESLTSTLVKTIESNKSKKNDIMTNFPAIWFVNENGLLCSRKGSPPFPCMVVALILAVRRTAPVFFPVLAVLSQLACRERQGGNSWPTLSLLLGMIVLVPLVF